MKAQVNRKEMGSTLIISLIMLIALTVLVVFAIRSGNTNLRIAGNTQSSAEANAAAQDAIEQTIEQVIAVDNPSLIAAQNLTVATGAKSYAVNVEAMNACLLEVAISSDQLSPAKPNDVPCFASVDNGDRAVMADGSLSAVPSECKTQQWEIKAHVDDLATGAKVDQIQGISIRVPSTVTCL